MTNRVDHIDIARGIAMLLVVAGHSCSSSTGYMNRMILAFHMPLFFYLSGVFASTVPKGSIKELLGGIAHKTKRLLVPQLLLGCTIIVLKGGAWVAHGNNLLDFDFLQGFRYWFLPTLWICSILFMVLTYAINLQSSVRKVAVLGITFALILVSFKICAPTNRTALHYVRIIPVAFFFYSIGSFTNTYALCAPKGHINKGLVLMLFASALFIVSQWNTPVKMYLGDYGYFPLFLVSSVLGIIVVLELSKRLTCVPVLTAVGRMCIAIYVWNFLIVQVTRFFLLKVLKLLGLYTAGVHAATTFALSLVILFFVCKYTLRFIPFVYGYSNRITIPNHCSPRINN